MSNMSYCRFENTLADLRDCARALDDGDADDLSENEAQAARSLVKLCRRIAEEHGHIADRDESKRRSRR